MIYGSVCSGIEAASVAWEPLGWQASFLSEIDKFPRAVLKHYYPETPLHGDFTTIGADQYEPIRLLVGGTPCQSFSIAGLRTGLDSKNGNLALQFLKLAQRTRPQWLVWENVPGCLSSNNGRDFGSILGGLAELRYGFAYRILDAQYYGVPQRRRRLFIVGYLADWRPAAAVLFERESLSWNTAPQRETQQETAGTIGGSSQSGGFRTTDLDNSGAFITVNRMLRLGKYINDGTVSTVAARDYKDATDLIATQPVVFQPRFARNGRGAPDNIAAPLTAEAGKSGKGDSAQCVAGTSAVRRLTPIECERLQGFPDNYTRIPWRKKSADNCPDSPRYKALGNSMAVPVMRWIGERIGQVEKIMAEEKCAEIISGMNA